MQDICKQRNNYQDYRDLVLALSGDRIPELGGGVRGVAGHDAHWVESHMTYTRDLETCSWDSMTPTTKTDLR